MSFRLILNLFYLLAVLLTCGFMYHHLTHFSGHIAVAAGGAETLVVREARDGFLGLHRAVPPELLQFTDRRAEDFLDPDKVYDSAALPFSLRLEAVEVLAEQPPQDVLEWELGGHTTSHPVASGDTVCFSDGACVEALAVAPWSGLLFQPGGAPMISLVFTGADLEKRYMLESGKHVLIDGAPAYFRWFASEEDARDALGADLSEGLHTRWGVDENGAMTWMSHPSPGQGLVTQDGREITVLAAHVAPEDRPRLELEIRRADAAAERVVLRPGDDGAHGLRFEAPRHAAHSLTIHAFPGDRVLLGEYRRGRLRETHEMMVGGAGISMRDGRLQIEQVMAAAIPIVTEDNAIFALEIQHEADRYMLREGDRVPWEGGYLRYRRKPTAPEVACRLGVYDNGELTASGRLMPGARLRFENWYFRIASAQHAPELVVFAAQRSGFARPGARIGMALFVVGALGWVLARSYRRASKL